MAEPAAPLSRPQPGEGSTGLDTGRSNLGPGAGRLSSVLARAVAGGRRRKRATPTILACSAYRRGSWRAQRLLHRSRARWKLIVSGRGVGKTHAGAAETLQIVMDSPPGSEGAVLAPTLTHAEASIAKLRELAAALPGVTDESWVGTKRRLYLPGGRSIKVFSADRKEVVRGPSIVVLWIDEAALVSERAIAASLPSLRTPGFKVRIIITTTPAGKNWVYDWWDKAGRGLLGNVERFRFRGTDSPYNDPDLIELYRQTMSPEKFAQEYGAEFVDNIILAFPDRDELFVDHHVERKDAPRCWLGVDIGQDDYYVCTLMNEWGEAVIVGRWNGETPGFAPATYFKQSQERVLELAKRFGATAVVDTGGRAGAPGAVLAEQLRLEGVEVLEIKTSSAGTKAEIVEQARLDVQWKKVTVLRDGEGWAAQLDYELSKFQGTKGVLHGREVVSYEGPQIRGEHDDCVISFALANWGRARGEKVVDPLKGDFSGFGKDDAEAGASGADDGWGAVGGGFTLRLASVLPAISDVRGAHGLVLAGLRRRRIDGGPGEVRRAA